jgi:hypothetical protein
MMRSSSPLLVLTLALPLALPLALGFAGCPKGDDVVIGPDGGVLEASKKAIDAAKYAAYMTRYPFGGRTIEWWSVRLSELKSGPNADAAVYALTVQRAQANGLIVDDATSPVTVKPGPELTAKLLARMELE